MHVTKPGDLCVDELPLLNLPSLKHRCIRSFLALFLAGRTSSEMEAPPVNCHGAEPILAVPRSPELRVPEWRWQLPCSASGY